jgi:hypothetical protein
MPSTYTLNNGIELIGTGEQSGTWGSTTNTNLELLDTALDGQVAVTLSSTGSSGSPNGLPISDGSNSDGRNRLITFNDGSDLGGTAYVQLTPNDAEKIIYVRNSLSGSRSILLFQGTYNASNDYEVPAGTTAVVFFNGAGTGAVAANVFNNAHFDALNVVGNVTVTGTVDAGTVEFDNLSGTGTVSVTNILDEDDMSSDSATALATQQSIKKYVDDKAAAQDTLSEVLANGNTTGGTNIVVSANDVISLDAGTNSLPALTNTGDLNTGLFFPAADTIGFSTGGDQALRIDSSQNVLVGAATTRRSLVGVGTGGIVPTLQLESSNTVSDGSLALISNYSTSAIGGSLVFARSRGSTTGSSTVVQDADYLGSIVFSGADGTDFGNYGSAIVSRVSGTPSTDNIPGKLLLQTTSTGASSVTRLRIASTGEMTFNNGDAPVTSGSYEFHQIGDTVNDGISIVNEASAVTLRLYTNDDNIRTITSGTTSMISFSTAQGSFPSHVALNTNVAINPDGNTITTGFPAHPLHIKSSTTTGMLVLESTDATNASAPDLYFYNNSATPADDDLIGNILFISNTDDGNQANMSQIFIQATDVSAGSANSKMMLKTAVNGNLDSRLILTGQGNVTIGTGTMERANLASGSAALSVEGTTASSAGMSIIRNSNDTSPSYLTLGKSRGSSEGSNTILQNGDHIGRIVFAANDGTNFLSTADIVSKVDETTPSTNNVGASLELRTGGSSNIEGISRVNIRSNGRVLFNFSTLSGEGAYIFKCLGNTNDDGLSIFSSDEGGSMRLLVDTAGVRTIYAGDSAVMTFQGVQSNAARVTFPKGDGIRVKGGQSAFTHTDFEPYNLGTVQPVLYLGYSSVSRVYDINAQTELAIERDGDVSVELVSNDVSEGRILFSDSAASARGSISYDHNTDVMKFKTASATAFDITSGGDISFVDGKGVLFSASESAGATSSLLHDYEEGSYTPVMTFGGSSINAPSWESGTYTKVGNRVFVDIRMSWSGSLGSESGGVKVTLPFAVANSESSTQWEAVASFYVLTNVTTTLVAAFSDVGGGLIFATAQGTSNEADHNDFPASSNFRVTGSYRTLA